MANSTLYAELEKYRQLFDKMELGVVFQDLEGKILEANPAAERILGIERSELLNMGSRDSHWQAIKTDGSEFPAEEHPAMLACRTGEVIRNVKMGIYNRMLGENRWLLINAVPEYKEGEGKPYRVFVTFSDITDQHRAEIKLIETETKFRALFENGPIGVAYHKMVYDNEGKPIDYFFLDANENYQKLTGVDPRGKLVTDAFPGIEKDPADWIGTFARAGKYGETIRFQQYLEPVDRWYDAVGYQSSPDHFVAAFLEITEQKKKELELQKLKDGLEIKVKERTQELLEAKEKAESANHAKSIFLANMSHELRTPLNAVLGYSEILGLKETDPKRKHYLDSILASGKTLLSLINDVLDLSKIEAGKFELQLGLVSIREVLREMEIIFGRASEEKGVAFTVEVDPQVPDSLIMDETRLRQVLINLVGNAIKFTEEGQITIQCKGREEPENPGKAELIISVKDTGIGISDHDQTRIFNAFEQAREQDTASYQGTGLGLAISRNLIEAMKGDIKLKSKAGIGSEFIIELRDVEIRQGSVQHSESDFNVTNLIFAPASIVIADDINYNREMLGTYLEAFNFELLFAKNGKEALQLVEKRKPDLVLMDMKMPVMDGYQASASMKKNPEINHIPVIAITASALKKDEPLIRENCESYLRKPVSRIRLIKEIMKYLSYEIQGTETSTDAEKMEFYQKNKPPVAVLSDLYELALDGKMNEIIEHAQKFSETEKDYSDYFDKIIELAVACKDTQLINMLKQEK